MKLKEKSEIGSYSNCFAECVSSLNKKPGVKINNENEIGKIFSFKILKMDLAEWCHVRVFNFIM